MTETLTINQDLEVDIEKFAEQLATGSNQQQAFFINQFSIGLCTVDAYRREMQINMIADELEEVGDDFIMDLASQIASRKAINPEKCHRCDQPKKNHPDNCVPA